jgi:DNA-binding transcriptional ArsR family regulator
MPVDFESYHLNDLPDEGTSGRRILEHLAQHPEFGLTPSELTDEFDIQRGSVGTTLSRLDERGLVRTQR